MNDRLTITDLEEWVQNIETQGYSWPHGRLALNCGLSVEVIILTWHHQICCSFCLGGKGMLFSVKSGWLVQGCVPLYPGVPSTSPNKPRPHDLSSKLKSNYHSKPKFQEPNQHRVSKGFRRTRRNILWSSHTIISRHLVTCGKRALRSECSYSSPS